MRQKIKLDPKMTDLQLFNSLELGDPWVDARLPSLLLYLLKNPKLTIPDGWQKTMNQMKADMEQFVTSMHYSYRYLMDMHRLQICIFYPKVMTQESLEQHLKDAEWVSALISNQDLPDQIKLET